MWLISCMKDDRVGKYLVTVTVLVGVTLVTAVLG